MSQENCASMRIDDLGVSQQCLDKLKQSGFGTVGELVEILEQIWEGRAGTVGYAPYLECLDETIDRLKVIGCWLEESTEIEG